MESLENSNDVLTIIGWQSMQGNRLWITLPRYHQNTTDINKIDGDWRTKIIHEEGYFDLDDYYASRYYSSWERRDANGGIVNGVVQEGCENVIKGTDGADEIHGLGGGDAIDGMGGNDIIFGGDSSDLLAGGGGSDIIKGGAGDDFIWANNHITMPDRNHPGERWKMPADGKKLIYAGPNWGVYIDHNDVMIFDGISSRFDNAADVGGDFLYGGDGSDYIEGDSVAPGSTEQGDDIIYGMAGNDYIVGGKGNDKLFGDLGWKNPKENRPQDNGNDTIYGEEGDDYIDGGYGNDYLDGGTGNDTVLGGGGNDVIYGGEGNDFLSGSNAMNMNDTDTAGGNDVIYGGAGNDQLFGGAGEDILEGGSGNDLLVGGSWQRDRYVFRAGYGRDEVFDQAANESQGDILDFVDYRSDELRLSRNGDDLLIGHVGSHDQVRLDNWFADTSYRQYQIHTADGMHHTAAQVQQLVGAMATFSSGSSEGRIWAADEVKQFAPPNILAANCG